MNNATLLADGPRPAVRLERQLPDPPAVVWRALTDREQLRAWFPCDVIVAGGRWEVGAAITFPFPPEVIDMTLSGEVLAETITWADARFAVLRGDITVPSAQSWASRSH